MRPRYESPEDLKNEKEIADFVERKYGIMLRKMPDRYYIDFMAFKDQSAVGVVEIKRRYRTVGKFSTLFLNLDKWTHGTKFFYDHGLPVSFVVGFDDGIYRYKYQTEDKQMFQIKFAGREDRGDPQDMEPVVQIPIGRLEKLERTR